MNAVRLGRIEWNRTEMITKEFMNDVTTEKLKGVDARLVEVLRGEVEFESHQILNGKPGEAFAAAMLDKVHYDQIRTNVDVRLKLIKRVLGVRPVDARTIDIEYEVVAPASNKAGRRFQYREF